MRLMKFRATPDSSPSASWDKPALFLARRRTRPNADLTASTNASPRQGSIPASRRFRVFHIYWAKALKREVSDGEGRLHASVCTFGALDSFDWSRRARNARGTYVRGVDGVWS